MSQRVQGNLITTGKMFTGESYSYLQYPQSRMSLGSNQTINDVTWTVVQLDTSEQDDFGTVDTTNNLIRAPWNGLYHIVALISHDHSAGDEQKARGVRITVNGNSAYPTSGVKYPQKIEPANNSSIDSRMQVDGVIYLDYGDTVQMEAYQNTGATNILDNSGNENAWSYLHITYLGEDTSGEAIK